MKKLNLAILFFFSCALIMGCAGKSKQKSVIDPNIPDNSPLAKIEKGMSEKQVIDLIGKPKEKNTTMSGKQWIPFYYGGDYRHTVFYYENLGRVTFNDGKRVIRVKYDKNEDGYIGENNQ